MSFEQVAPSHLKEIIANLERLDIEKTEVSNHMKDVYAEAKAQGFDIKTLKSVLKIRKMDKSQRQEQEELLDLYLSTLGMN
jgi:uncharacterized protein (UPF0335 family)